ncbi:hypothetical protein ASG19_16125 [Rhizobium sp. Leaf306]|jgi:hypothetical protein|uniref:Lectin-like protein BA14k n=1 Tax=Rhizobium soli TaxID=424798 RepID=A0A7X0JM57_9HYPH|nr:MULTISPECIES: BA14K family protein [Rhizobium]KQQ35247.1 hypothetical protein ASG19_16125 [Rhizobium sp. Leaf306]MBB6510148.1 putative lipid-binding transport protein (Tim44 family) [Rhizobium soli]
MKKLAIIIISIMTAFTGYVPAQAMPKAAITAAAPAADVQQVQYRNDNRRYVPRGERRYNNRYDRRDRYDRRNRYSNHRRHDRRYDNRRRNNTGAIIGGLAAGALIGGAIASQNRNGSSSCAARYRSYRASDNTYQPNSGPRRVCR